MTEPIPLNAVRAAAADVAADISGTAVAAPVAGIAGVVRDFAADAWATLAGATTDTAAVAADARAAALADAAADVVAAADLAGDLYRPPPLWPPLPPLRLPLLALKPAARAWLPSVPSELLLSSTRTRRPSSWPN